MPLSLPTQRGREGVHCYCPSGFPLCTGDSKLEEAHISVVVAAQPLAPPGRQVLASLSLSWSKGTSSLSNRTLVPARDLRLCGKNRRRKFVMRGFSTHRSRTRAGDSAPLDPRSSLLAGRRGVSGGLDQAEGRRTDDLEFGRRPSTPPLHGNGWLLAALIRGTGDPVSIAACADILNESIPILSE